MLPLETWRRLLSWNPWHFWGLSDSQYTPIDGACSDLVYKYAWQGTGAGSRGEIERAIRDAERKFRNYMHFRPAPEYVSETVQFPTYHQPLGVWRGRAAIDGRWPSVQVPEGYVQGLGVESLTLIGTANLAYTDEDGDGLLDTFTATIVTTQTDSTKIAVYFASADRWDDSPVGPHWRIEPVRVSISGGVATVKGRRWQVVKPVLYETQDQETPLDPTESSTFVTTLEVYVRTLDPTGTTVTNSQVAYTWESLPHADWWGVYCCSSDGSTDPAATATAAGRGGVRNSRLGLVSVGSALYNSTTSTWDGVEWGHCRTPNTVTVRYLAGYPLQNGEMVEEYARIIAYLAAAELPAPACEDYTVFKRMHYYQFDMSRGAGQMDEQYSITQQDLQNPFGTRRGQVIAWRDLRIDSRMVNLSGISP